MCVHVVALSCDYFCYGNVTILSLCMVILHVAVNNIKLLVLPWRCNIGFFFFAQLLSYKTFQALENSINIPALKCPKCLYEFNQIFTFLTDFNNSPRYQILR
jgi:hypothetical protein